MGRLCTLRFTLRHLVVCPAIPLFLYSSRCTTLKVLVVPCLQRLHSIKDGSGEGTGTDGTLEKILPRPSVGAPSQSGVDSSGPTPFPLVSTHGEDGHGARTRKLLDDAKSNGIDLPGRDRDCAFPMVPLNRGNVDMKRELSATSCKFFSVTKAKLELRSQIVGNLLLNILDVHDFKMVGHVLNEWLRKFVSRRYEILATPDNLSAHGGFNNHNPTPRFVPYTQVARIVHQVMRDLGQKGHRETALEVLRWMEGQGWCQLDPHMYTTIIASLGEAGSFELANKIFYGLDCSQVRKDVALYNALLNARGRARQIDSLEDLFESMKRSACKPDLVSYNIVMNSYVKAGMGLGSVVGLFRDMYVQGIVPDLVSFDILLQACVSGRHVTEAQKIFENLKKRALKPSVVTYTTLITLYADCGYSTQALELLIDMLAEKCQPNTLTFSSLINAFGRDGNTEEAERLFESMKELGVEPNVITYNTMIDMYGKGGDCEMAQQKFKELEQAGLEPTGATLACLMSSLKAIGAYDKVLVLYDQAKQESICNEHVFTEAIDAYIKCGKLQRIKDIQYDMVAFNCSPNVVTCSIVLAALGSKCSNAQDAGVLVNFLQGFDSDLAVNSCQMLLKQMSGDKEVLNNIESLFVSLSSEDVKTWNVFTGALVDALWVLGWYRRAAHVVAWVMQKGVFHDICVIQPQEWKLDLRRLSSGTALVALHQWLGHLVIVPHLLEDSKQTNLQDYVDTYRIADAEGPEGQVLVKASGVFGKVVPVHMEVLLPLLPVLSELTSTGFLATAKCELGGDWPPLVTIVTGWGKLSKQKGSSIVKTSVRKEILKLRAPFRPSADSGRWMAEGERLMLWLMSPKTASRLALSDMAHKAENVQ